jgi:hypothetical protein
MRPHSRLAETAGALLMLVIVCATGATFAHSFLPLA